VTSDEQALKYISKDHSGGLYVIELQKIISRPAGPVLVQDHPI
jgi:hypothetical protein